MCDLKEIGGVLSLACVTNAIWPSSNNQQHNEGPTKYLKVYGEESANWLDPKDPERPQNKCLTIPSTNENIDIDFQR